MAVNGSVLAEFRRVRGFSTRVAIATAADLSEPTCWRIERTERPISSATLASYAEALGVLPEAVAEARAGRATIVAALVRADEERHAQASADAWSIGASSKSEFFG